MPTQTVATFADGLVEFQVDYDTSNRVTAVRCVNNSDHTCRAEVSQESNGRTRSGSFAPGTTTIAVPTGQSQRITVVVDAIRNHLLTVRLWCEG